jgi:RNA polymerase sigma-70 factor (ECF subfamily)
VDAFSASQSTHQLQELMQMSKRNSMSKAISDMDGESEQWFVNEILPHEAALKRYLHKVWRSPDEVADLRQETYVRVYESGSRARPRSPKTFLFTTARNLMIDKMRRERIVSIDYTQDIHSLDVSMDELTPERRLTAREELQRLSEAFDRLPDTTRTVIWLRRVAGLSQKETARALSIKEGALEGHMTRGLRSLAQTILSNPIEETRRREDPSNQETEDGQRSD